MILVLPLKSIQLIINLTRLKWDTEHISKLETVILWLPPCVTTSYLYFIQTSSFHTLCADTNTWTRVSSSLSNSILVFMLMEFIAEVGFLHHPRHLFTPFSNPPYTISPKRFVLFLSFSISYCHFFIWVIVPWKNVYLIHCMCLLYFLLFVAVMFLIF
jgi:hypothetical protein